MTMAKTDAMPKVLTANRLRDGATVYFTGAGWSLHVGDAKVAHSPEDADALAKVGAAAHAANEVVEVNVVDVDASANLVPSRLRELIRAQGPTVRRDLNKELTEPASRQG